MVKDLDEHYGYETISYECPKCKEWNHINSRFCEKCRFELNGI